MCAEKTLGQPSRNLEVVCILGQRGSYKVFRRHISLLKQPVNYLHWLNSGPSCLLHVRRDHTRDLSGLRTAGEGQPTRATLAPIHGDLFSRCLPRNHRLYINRP